MSFLRNRLDHLQKGFAVVLALLSVVLFFSALVFNFQNHSLISRVLEAPLPDATALAQHGSAPEQLLELDQEEEPQEVDDVEAQEASKEAADRQAVIDAVLEEYFPETFLRNANKSDSEVYEDEIRSRLKACVTNKIPHDRRTCTQTRRDLYQARDCRTDSTEEFLICMGYLK